MHVSLDGFVAGSSGEMDWIHVDDEIFEYAGNETDKADTALYGRVTYEMMEAYWPTAGDKPGAGKHDIQHSNWYNKTPKVILSSTLKEAELKNTKVIVENIPAEIMKLKRADGKNIVIFGSPRAAQTLMAANLIDEFWLFINPVLLGKGIPLFNGIKERINLKLLTSRSFSSGVVCAQYVKI
jgi:dihydrofolate reductase